MILRPNKNKALVVSRSRTVSPLHGDLVLSGPPGGSGWIISVGDYADNSFAALGSSDPREVRLEL